LGDDSQQNNTPRFMMHKLFAAALLASLLHDGLLTVEQIKLDLLARGLPIRPLTSGLPA
jgi:imidazole glycerol phosphate synthase subunit HisF